VSTGLPMPPNDGHFALARRCVIRAKSRFDTRKALFGAAVVVLLASGAVSTSLAEDLDWSRFSEVEEIHVLTTDDAGEQRETTIWLAVLDGDGYIRTSQSTRWGDDVERNPDIALRIGSEVIPVRASFIEEEELREKVGAAFREKYGWSDSMISVIRGSRPRIMHVESRKEVEE